MLGWLCRLVPSLISQNTQTCMAQEPHHIIGEQHVIEVGDIVGGMVELEKIKEKDEYFRMFLATDVTKLPTYAPRGSKSIDSP